jgi:hypothetical protein
MVTNDYRGYRKGVYVRLRKNPGARFQNGSQKTAPNQREGLIVRLATFLDATPFVKK